MAEEVILTVNDTDNSGEQMPPMTFDGLSELARLLKMAGVETDQPEIATDQNGAFDVDVDKDGAISIPTDENADFDYGNNPTSRKGYVYDVDQGDWQGDADLDMRYVPARYADNPLRRVGEGKRFGEYLKEVENKG